MRMKLAVILGAALALTATTGAQAQWGGRGNRMRQLEWACDNGDDDACDRLQAQRRRWREEREWRERDEERDDWRQRERRNQFRQPAPQVDPKVATCFAIETNYNNCVKQHQGRPGHENDCLPWVLQLKANHCF